MALRGERLLIGKDFQKKHKKVLTKMGYQKTGTELKLDGDAEAGVDPQVDQVNTMPNDPTVQPKEPGQVK